MSFWHPGYLRRRRKKVAPPIIPGPLSTLLYTKLNCTNRMIIAAFRDMMAGGSYSDIAFYILPMAASEETILSMLLVNNQFYRILLPLVYERVNWRDWGHGAAFLTSVIKPRELVGCANIRPMNLLLRVHTLQISFNLEEGSDDDEDEEEDEGEAVFWKLFREGFVKMENLRRLQLAYSHTDECILYRFKVREIQVPQSLKAMMLLPLEEEQGLV